MTRNRNDQGFHALIIWIEQGFHALIIWIEQEFHALIIWIEQGFHALIIWIETCQQGQVPCLHLMTSCSSPLSVCMLSTRCISVDTFPCISRWRDLPLLVQWTGPALSPTGQGQFVIYPESEHIVKRFLDGDVSFPYDRSTHFTHHLIGVVHSPFSEKLIRAWIY